MANLDMSGQQTVHLQTTLAIYTCCSDPNQDCNLGQSTSGGELHNPDCNLDNNHPRPQAPHVCTHLLSSTVYGDNWGLHQCF